MKPFSTMDMLLRVRPHLQLARFRRHMQHLVDEQTAKLSQSERRYRDLAALSPIGIVQGDANSRVVFSNERWREIHGVKDEEEAQGHKWMECIHPDSRPEIPKWMEAMGRREAYTNEIKYLRPDGSVTWGLVQGIPIEDGGNICSVTDITEIKNLQQQRMEAMQLAESEQRSRALQADEHRRQQELFCDTICHEIRNPLNGIVNFAELLLDSLNQRELIMAAPDPDTLAALNAQLVGEREAIEGIALCAQHQQVVTNDVLDLSKLEAGKVSLNNVNFSPQDLVERALKILQAELQRKDITSHLQGLPMTTSGW
eukprot:TRINITY_DN9374_c0_g1_i9.p1 TRINITY_DN9374_c0_g1~~TRINITY_DN9374_c0_g1_i9.p1  ORF type:complete len:323 (-),score=92.36 TRINITY_DN9374_c0_g1_i9:102-1040(-)